ncbi:hypothetical protein AB0J25_11865 [Streptomyces sp. NPDC049910]|uniref:hypothetical protein n=1 Tax=Streptomyces sp. NPDC049910 TaxID=3155278 RepID=UPI00341FC2CA
MARNKNMIAALLRERAGYEARNLPERVAQVDDQLERYGYKPEGDDTEGPKGRSGADSQQQTANSAAPKTTAAKSTPAKKAAASSPAGKE